MKISSEFDLLTRELIVQYANSSGDTNPIHTRDEIAEKMGLKGVIAHGLFSLGFIVKLLDELVKETGKILKTFGEMRGQVRPGDKLITELTVKSVEGDVVNFDVLQKTITKIKIAVPDFKNYSKNNESPELAGALAGVIANDLDLSGYFLSMDKNSFLDEDGPEITAGNINFRSWSLIGKAFEDQIAPHVNGRTAEGIPAIHIGHAAHAQDDRFFGGQFCRRGFRRGRGRFGGGLGGGRTGFGRQSRCWRFRRPTASQQARQNNG